MKLKRNDFVTVKRYKNKGYQDCKGRIISVSFSETKPYYVSSMNMPFCGAINDWFEEKELVLMSNAATLK